MLNIENEIENILLKCFGKDSVLALATADGEWFTGHGKGYYAET